jgi:hypothetical protein
VAAAAALVVICGGASATASGNGEQSLFVASALEFCQAETL